MMLFFRLFEKNAHRDWNHGKDARRDQGDSPPEDAAQNKGQEICMELEMLILLFSILPDVAKSSIVAL